jgi:hypothetical protein
MQHNPVGTTASPTFETMASRGDACFDSSCEIRVGDMNWGAIGAIGEIPGAAGVIVTLIYLARQIRQNTRATKLSMSHSIASATREWNRPLLQDPELAWTFQVGTEDPTRLDEKEQARFVELCFSLLRMFEDAHYQYAHGALDPEVWRGYEKLFGAHAKAPGFQAYWKVREDTFRPEFRDFIAAYEAPGVPTWGALGGFRGFGQGTE